MEAALGFIGVIVAGLVSWALAHTQSCTKKMSDLEHRLTKLEGK